MECSGAFGDGSGARSAHLDQPEGHHEFDEEIDRGRIRGHFDDQCGILIVDDPGVIAFRDGGDLESVFICHFKFEQEQFADDRFVRIGGKDVDDFGQLGRLRFQLFKRVVVSGRDDRDPERARLAHRRG